MNKERYGAGIAMTDLATNLLGVFICLFMLAFLLMSKKIEEKNNKIESKAEFLITVTWNKELDVDIDTYVEDPVGNLVFFRCREKGLMHLERDDIGHTNDKITINGETFQVNENMEVVTIRGVVPGEYVVNIHMYANKAKAPKTAITIKVEKVNPSLKIIAFKELNLTEVGEEKTALRFTVDKSGDVTNTNDLPKDIARKYVPGSPSHNLQSPEDFDPDGEATVYPEFVPPNNEGTP